MQEARPAPPRRRIAALIVLGLAAVAVVPLLQLNGLRRTATDARPSSAGVPVTGAFEATYVPDGYTASEQIEEPVWAPLPPIVGKEDDQPDEVPATPIPGRTIHTQDFDQDAGDGIVVIHVIQGPPVLEVAEELAANPDAELFTLGSGTPAVLLPQNSESSLDQVLFAAGTFTVQVIGRNVSQELVVDMAEGVEVD